MTAPSDAVWREEAQAPTQPLPRITEAGSKPLVTDAEADLEPLVPAHPAPIEGPAADWFDDTAAGSASPTGDSEHGTDSALDAIDELLGWDDDSDLTSALDHEAGQR